MVINKGTNNENGIKSENKYERYEFYNFCTVLKKDKSYLDNIPDDLKGLVANTKLQQCLQNIINLTTIDAIKYEDDIKNLYKEVLKWSLIILDLEGLNIVSITIDNPKEPNDTDVYTISDYLIKKLNSVVNVGDKNKLKAVIYHLIKDIYNSDYYKKIIKNEYSRSL